MQLTTTIILFVNLAWTILLFSQPSHTTIANYLYNGSYGLNFILASYLCLKDIKKYISARLVSTFLFLGYLSFSIAQAIWLTFNLILQTDVPYPGPADFFWLLFYVLMILGFIQLLLLCQSSLNLGSFMEISLISGIIYLLLSSFLSLHTTQSGLPLLTQLLNYAYPIADSVLISISIIALHSQAGRLNPRFLYFILGFICLALGDTLFAYQSTLDLYWNGNIADFLYALAGFFLLSGTIHLPALYRSTNVAASSNISPSPSPESPSPIER